MPPDDIPPKLAALVCTRSVPDCDRVCGALRTIRVGVLQVSDLTDAFRLAAKDCFVLIVVDLNLDPQWRSALRTLQQAAPGAALIAYSHSPDERLWIDALEAGAFDFVCSPILKRDLEWILDNALKARADRTIRPPCTPEVLDPPACGFGS